MVHLPLWVSFFPQLPLKGFHSNIEYIIGCLLFSPSTKATETCINLACAFVFPEGERELGENYSPAKCRQRHLGS